MQIQILCLGKSFATIITDEWLLSFMNRQNQDTIIEQKCSFSGWGQFLQKLCKNCPHPENSFSNSKTISQIEFPYRIENSSNHSRSGRAEMVFCYHNCSDLLSKLYIPSTPNNLNETHTFMCLGRTGRFGQR